MSRRRFLLPILILSAGLTTAGFLARGKPEAPALAPVDTPPAINVLTVRQEPMRLLVYSQGTVTPRTKSEVVARVPGQVLEVGPGLEPGAFFSRGDVLLRLDSRDLELARRRAAAVLDRARAEEQYAAATLRRKRRLADSGVSSDAVIDETLRAARTASALRIEAEIDLARAEQDLERATIRAPFDGRTLTRHIDVGRYVSVGTPLAELYAVDYAEVRLPIPDAELAYLDLSIGESVGADEAPAVELSAEFAGRRHAWTGRIVRTEARIDPRTRMVHVIARVADPYASSEDAPGRPPLAAGLFVEAEIEGRALEDVVRVPRDVLDDTHHLYVLTDGDRLRRRPVEVLRFERTEAVITDGLEPTDRVSLMAPRLAREGLAVQPIEIGTLAELRAEARTAS